MLLRKIMDLDINIQHHANRISDGYELIIGDKYIDYRGEENSYYVLKTQAYYLLLPYLKLCNVDPCIQVRFIERFQATDMQLLTREWDKDTIGKRLQAIDENHDKLKALAQKKQEAEDLVDAKMKSKYYTSREVAKILNLQSHFALLEALKKADLIYYVKNKPFITPKYLGKGLVKKISYASKGCTIRWTVAGLKMITDILGVSVPNNQELLLDNDNKQAEQEIDAWEQENLYN